MRRGFTLVELLAVIVILAIILAIALPNITSIVSNTTKDALESDAKMILKQLGYEKLQDDTFDMTGINESTITNLNLSNSNYEDLKIGVINNKPYIIIVGKEKWSGLKACGTSESINVVDVTDTSTCENVPITIASMHPKPVDTTTCNPSNLSVFCLSEISLFPYEFTPTGYLQCNGALTSISSYPALGALIGGEYSGDGRTTFGLPNLTSIIPLSGLKYYIATSGNSPDWSGVTPLASGNNRYFTFQSTFGDYLVGEIKLAADVNEDDGMMLLCNGRTLSIAAYPALFSTIGIKFGGNGATTFNLPDLRSAVSPVSGLQYYIVTSGTLPPRS